MYLWDLLDWLTDCGSGGPTMAISTEEGVPRRESNIYSVHETECLCSPHRGWSPGGVLESCQPSVYTGNPGSQLLTVVKDQQDLLSRGEAGKKQTFFPPFVWQPPEGYHPDSGSCVH